MKNKTSTVKSDAIKNIHATPNKLLGQHFLIDAAVLQQIVTTARVGKKNIILEAGPGRGTLTFALAKKVKQIIAVEKDAALMSELQKKLSEENIQNIILLEGDILDFNPRQHDLHKEKYKIVANLPYYLSGAFLKKFLTDPEHPESMTLLLQKEVAERMTATPPHMSLLSLSAQTYGKPEIIATVPQHSFYPKPRVDSAIVRISKISGKFFKKNNIAEQLFWIIARAGFAQKRKMLANNLSGTFRISKTELENIFFAAQIPQMTRAESLSLTQWATLTRFLAKKVIQPRTNA